MIWQAVEAVLMIFLMIGVGVFVSWRGWVSRETANVFPKLVVNLALPSLIITSFSENFTRQKLFDAWLPILVIFIVVPLSFFIGRAAARLFRIPKHRRGIFTVLFAFSNSVFIGFPVSEALFGDMGIHYAVFYYLSNTTFFWILGYMAIRKDADLISGKHSRITVKEVARKLLTPPIISIFVMGIVVLGEIRLPNLITSTAGYIGSLTSPLSLMFMGCMIHSVGLSAIKYEKGVGAVMMGRFILAPALCFGGCTLAIFLLGGGEIETLSMMRNVFTVQTGLPVMISAVIVAELYGADVEYATKNVIWTTLASLVTIPVYMVLFQYI